MFFAAQGELEEAIEYAYRKALFDRNLIVLKSLQCNMAAVTSAAQGKLEEAIEAYSKALAHQS